MLHFVLFLKFIQVFFIWLVYFIAQNTDNFLSKIIIITSYSRHQPFNYLYIWILSSNSLQTRSQRTVQFRQRIRSQTRLVNQKQLVSIPVSLFVFFARVHIQTNLAVLFKHNYRVVFEFCLFYFLTRRGKSNWVFMSIIDLQTWYKGDFFLSEFTRNLFQNDLHLFLKQNHTFLEISEKLILNFFCKSFLLLYLQ